MCQAEMCGIVIAFALCGEGVEVVLETICSLWNRRWTTELLSRLLVLLTALLLFMMPITEYLCDWDHFLRGGPDVEFSVLAWLLFAAMVVLTMNGTILQPAWMTENRRTIVQGREITARGRSLPTARAVTTHLPYADADCGFLSSPPLRI